MKKTLVIILLLVLALFAVSAAAENTEALGQLFPDFTAEDTDGNTFTLSGALKDHEAVLINIWATWCGPCRNEFPDLNEVYREYKDRVAFIALSSEPADTIQVISDFRKELGLDIPMGREEGTGLTSYLDVMGIPTTVIVDRFGNAVFMQSGAFSGAEEVKHLLDAVLGEKYTETTVIDEIPRDTSTRALPVSAAREIHVENEGARRAVIHSFFDYLDNLNYDYEVYVLNDSTARLRFEIAASDNPAGMSVYCDNVMHEIFSLLDVKSNTYVLEYPMPDEQAEQHYSMVALGDRYNTDGEEFRQIILLESEKYKDELLEEIRGLGATAEWEYAEDRQGQAAAAADAYILHMTDQYGKPVSGVMANFCTDAACNTMVSDEKGIITVSGTPEDYHVQLLKAPEGYSFDKEFEMNTGTAFGEWTILIRKD